MGKENTVVLGDGDDETKPKKKQSPADDLICPITLLLPIDPVAAEDGRIYEHAAILRHIKGHDTDSLKSPMTNEPMGPRLLP